MITIKLGDITTEKVDVIVNAANRTLLGGGGVDGAIHRVAGPELLAACADIRAVLLPEGLPTGEAIVTDAYDLPAKWVVHTVGPVWDTSVPFQDRVDLLINAYFNSAQRARELGAQSLAFPAISAGVYGCPMNLSAIAGVSTAREFEDVIPDIRFVLFDQAAYDTWVDEEKDNG